MQIGKQIVVSTVDQQIQNGQSPQFLQQLLSNPAAIGQKDLQQLEKLAETYPQCSIFHLLLAKAAQTGEAATAAKMLQSAAVYAPNREVLFRLIHQPELIVSPKPEVVFPEVSTSPETEPIKPNASFTDKIPVKDEDEIILSGQNSFAESYPVEIINTSFDEEKVVPVEEEAILLEEAYPEEKPSAENVDASFIEEKLEAENLSEETIIDEENPSAESDNASFTGEKSVEETLSVITGETHLINPTQEEILVENDLRVEDVNLNFIIEPVEDVVFLAEEETQLKPQTEETNVLSTQQEIAKPILADEIDEDVYDEITAIEDIRFEVVKTASPEETQTVAEPEKTVEKLPLLNVQDKAEKDMLSSIASIDYFTFNNKFGQNHTEQVSTVTEDVSVKTESPLVQKEADTVSKYHDDKMPYSFMWWLDKTRKEHSGTYQPYVKTPTATHETGLTAGPELNQQYIESIFHAKPVHEMVESSHPPIIQPVVSRKEDKLIERFIIEEPHIHPPSSDKLDTENKAKKSSEDADVLVTETLAKIYLDQMLYHKALDTYKKLVLKFPEKSSYFAAQIDLIEKKIN